MIRETGHKPRGWVVSAVFTKPNGTTFDISSMPSFVVSAKSRSDIIMEYLDTTSMALRGFSVVKNTVTCDEVPQTQLKAAMHG